MALDHPDPTCEAILRITLGSEFKHKAYPSESQVKTLNCTRTELSRALINDKLCQVTENVKWIQITNSAMNCFKPYV